MTYIILYTLHRRKTQINPAAFEITPITHKCIYAQIYTCIYTRRDYSVNSHFILYYYYYYTSCSGELATDMPARPQPPPRKTFLDEFSRDAVHARKAYVYIYYLRYMTLRRFLNFFSPQLHIFYNATRRSRPAPGYYFIIRTRAAIAHTHTHTHTVKAGGVTLSALVVRWRPPCDTLSTPTSRRMGLADWRGGVVVGCPAAPPPPPLYSTAYTYVHTCIYVRTRRGGELCVCAAPAYSP